MSTGVLRNAMAAAIVAMSAAMPAGAALQDRSVSPVAADAEEAMWYGDIDALERLYAKAQADASLNPRTGRPMIAAVRSGMSSPFRYGGLTDAYFRELELLTERWARERPKSRLAQLLYARALYARAWHERGSGYWQTVPEPAKAEFTRLIAMAQKQIADHATLLADDTTSHIYLLMIGRSAGWSLAAQRAVVEDGVARQTRDEDDLYEEFVVSLLPKGRSEQHANASARCACWSRQFGRFMMDRLRKWV